MITASRLCSGVYESTANLPPRRVSAHAASAVERSPDDSVKARFVVNIRQSNWKTLGSIAATQS